MGAKGTFLFSQLPQFFKLFCVSRQRGETSPLLFARDRLFQQPANILNLCGFASREVPHLWHDVKKRQIKVKVEVEEVSPLNLSLNLNLNLNLNLAFLDLTRVAR
jgi:hypothetical protein